MHSMFRVCVLALPLLLPSFSGIASQLQVTVLGGDNQVLSDAVVELIATNSPALTVSDSHFEMAQQNRTFIPFVMAVPVGAKVDFPNLDRTRHHVYSFSEAKPFELKLYVGKAEEPIVFDKTGIVALGCNIHDYMQAFIYVAKSPLVAVSDDKGLVQFNAVSKGHYQVKIWHPWQKAVPALTELTLAKDSEYLTLSLDIERQEKPSAPPAGFSNVTTVGFSFNAK